MGKIIEKPLDGNLKAFFIDCADNTDRYIVRRHPIKIELISRLFAFGVQFPNLLDDKFRKLPFDEMIRAFHFRLLSSFDFTLSGHNLS